MLHVAAAKWRYPVTQLPTLVFNTCVSPARTYNIQLACHDLVERVEQSPTRLPFTRAIDELLQQLLRQPFPHAFWHLPFLPGLRVSIKARRTRQFIPFRRSTETLSGGSLNLREQVCAGRDHLNPRSSQLTPWLLHNRYHKEAS